MKKVRIKPIMFSAMAAFLAMPSLAQSFEGNPVSAASSAAIPQHISSVVYMNVADENQVAGTISVDATPGLGDEANMSASSKLRVFRADRLSVTNSRSNVFSKNDLVSFMVNAPMPEVNSALSLVGTINQTPLDGTLTKLVQVMTMLATRKIKAEIAYAYSAKVNKYSSFDSVLSYSLDKTADTANSNVVASFRYSAKF